MPTLTKQFVESRLLQSGVSPHESPGITDAQFLAMGIKDKTLGAVRRFFGEFNSHTRNAHQRAGVRTVPMPTNVASSAAKAQKALGMLNTNNGVQLSALDTVIPSEVQQGTGLILDGPFGLSRAKDVPAGQCPQMKDRMQEIRIYGTGVCLQFGAMMGEAVVMITNSKGKSVIISAT